jgi:predicted PurR-regulated permease PerM
MNKENFERAKWLPIFIIAIILMIIYKTIDNFTQITEAVRRFLVVISPLLYGILFAYFLYIPHSKIEKLIRKSKVKFFSSKARGFSTICVFLLLILIIALIITIVVPILITSVLDLANSIPAYMNFILDYFENLPDDSIWASLGIADTVRDSSVNIINQYINVASIEQVARGIINIAGEIASLMLGLIVSLYLLLERERVLEFFKKLGNALFKSEKARNRLTKYLNQVNRVLFTFIASKGLDSIINLIVVTSILLIFNVPYAFLLGLIAGLFNFIPYLGSLIAVILISLITVITGGLSQAITVLIPLLIFQQLDGNYIEPRIMKSSLKISPILVIVAVVAGGAYFGVLGMFFAVPIATIIKQILIEYVNHSE